MRASLRGREVAAVRVALATLPPAHLTQFASTAKPPAHADSSPKIGREDADGPPSGGLLCSSGQNKKSRPQDG